MNGRLILFFTFLLNFFNIVSQETDSKLIIETFGHTGTVTELIFSSDRSILYSFSHDKTIRVWNIQKNALDRVLRPNFGSENEEKIYAAALSPDNKLLIFGGLGYKNKKLGCPIHFINTDSAKQTALVSAHSEAINDLKFSPDGKYIVSASNDKTVKIWELNITDTSFVCQPIATIKEHKRIVNTVQWSSDGKYLLTTSYDKKAIIFDLSNPREPLMKKTFAKHKGEITASAFSPDGNLIATGDNKQVVMVWNTDGEIIAELTDFPAKITSIDFSPRNDDLLISYDDYSDNVAIFSIERLGAKLLFPEHNNTVFASSWGEFAGNARSKQLVAATAGGNSNDIFLWNTVNGEILNHFKGNGCSVWAVAFDAGNRVAFGFNEYNLNYPKHTKLETVFDFKLLKMSNIAEAETNTFVRNVTEINKDKIFLKNQYELYFGKKRIKIDKNYDGVIRCFSYTKKGNVVVGCSNSLKLFNTKSKPIREFKGHNGEILAIGISADDNYLTSVSNDQTLKLWNLNTGELLVTLFTASDNQWVCFTPQGYYATSENGEKYVGWITDNGVEKLSTFFSNFTFREKFAKPALVALVIEKRNFETALKHFNNTNNK